MSNFRNVVRSYSPEALAVVGKDIEGLFDQLFSSTPQNGSADQVPAGSSAKSLRVPAQVWEQGDQLHIQLELPGVARDAVNVTFERGEIHIVAEKKSSDLGDHQLLHNSRRYGSLHQRVAVSDSYDADTIEAAMSDGVLYLKVSKKPVVQPRKIEIQ